MKVALVIDSSSNCFHENIEVDGIYQIPLHLVYRNQLYLEGTEVTSSSLKSFLLSDHLVSTGIPSIQTLCNVFESIKKDGYDLILALPISNGISNLTNVMRNAALLANIDFDTIDCYSPMYITLETALFVRKMLDQGYSVSDTKHLVSHNINGANTFIIPKDLKFLSLGGRLSTLSMQLGSLLKIKPILQLSSKTQGKIDPYSKVRTTSKAIDTIVHAMKEDGVDSSYHIHLASYDDENTLNKTIETLSLHFPKTPIHICELVPTIAAHVGLGSLALQYIQTYKSPS